jgi:hypothetical protein
MAPLAVGDVRVQGVEDRREMAAEFHVHGRTYDGDDAALFHFTHGGTS